MHTESTINRATNGEAPEALLESLHATHACVRARRFSLHSAVQMVFRIACGSRELFEGYPVPACELTSTPRTLLDQARYTPGERYLAPKSAFGLFQADP